MSILAKLFGGYESSIYSNPEDQLKAMRRWTVEWQKHVCNERFHITKKHGKFTSDEFFKIVRDTVELIDGEITYEGIELYPIVGACTSHAVQAHSRMARRERSIMAPDVNEFFSCETRIYPKEKYKDHDHVWLNTDGYGKRISFSIALSREAGDKIIDKYFVKSKDYNLGDGFLL